LMSNDHSETHDADITYTFDTQELLSIDWDTDNISPGGTIAFAGSKHLNLQGLVFIQGVSFLGNTSYNTIKIATNRTHYPNSLVFRDCTFRMYHYSIQIGTGYICRSMKTRFENCTVNFINPAQSNLSGIHIAGGVFEWDGGSVTGASPLYMFCCTSSSAVHYMVAPHISNVDFSIIDKNLLQPTANKPMEWSFHRCRLNAGVSIFSEAPSVAGNSLRLSECDSGTNYIRQHYEDFTGIVTEDTVRKRADSTYSHKLVSSANSKFYLPLKSFPIARYNATEGSAITVRVETLTDNVTLTNGEFWIEGSYLGNASYPLGSIQSSRKADILASDVNLSASAVDDWTTTDIGDPVKQYAEITFTPQKSGAIQITAYLAKASTTVYVDTGIGVS
jgi:hypothetical protein